jgi:hypothetical protein
MSTTEQFRGFDEHIARYLGEVERVESARAQGGDRGYDLLFCRHPQQEVVSVVTDGLRWLPFDGDLPEELVCSVRPDQESAALYLTDTVAGMVLANRGPLEYGRVIPSPDPLLSGTVIQGVLAQAHPYAPDDFDVLRDDTGEPELHMVTLVPISAAEVALAQADGVDALHERWRAAGTDLMNVSRPSAV